MLKYVFTKQQSTEHTLFISRPEQGVCFARCKVRAYGQITYGDGMTETDVGFAKWF